MEIKTMCKLLKFEDLSEEVQQELIEKNRNQYVEFEGDHVNEMFKDSRKKFESIFCLSNHSNKTTMLEEDLRGVRLATWLNNNIYDELVMKKSFILGYDKNYKFRQSKIIIERSSGMTGTCTDDYYTQPIFDFIAKPNDNTSLNDLIYECLENARVGADQMHHKNYSDDESIADYLLNQDEDYNKAGEVIPTHSCAA